jgi:hypothetical protein
MLASYTFSKVIDVVSDHFTVNPGVDDFDQLSDESNPRADRSPGANDQRHRFVFSEIWHLNYARGLSKPLRALFEGWQVSAIFVAQSGHPYSGPLNYDLNRDGNLATVPQALDANRFKELPCLRADPCLITFRGLGRRRRRRECEHPGKALSYV